MCKMLWHFLAHTGSIVTNFLMAALAPYKFLAFFISNGDLFHALILSLMKVFFHYDKQISSNKTINVLGVIFDTKLQWSDHVSHVIKRSMTALNAIRLIKIFFYKKGTA